MKKLFSIFTLILLVSLSSPQPTYATANNQTELTDEELYVAVLKTTKDQEMAESYLIRNPDGFFTMNSQKVRANKLSQDNQLFIAEYLKIKNQYNSSYSSNTQNRSINIIVYGNYCGKGNNGGAPKDTLDAACKAHDNCYAKYGWGNCNCDKALVIKAVIIAESTKYSSKQRIAARAVSTFFGPKVLTCR